MTLRWIEGFEIADNLTDLTLRYEAVAGGITFTTGRYHGTAARMQSVSGAAFQLPDFTAASSWIVGMSVKPYNLSTTPFPFLEFSSASAIEGTVALVRGAVGFVKFQIYRGTIAGGTLLQQSSEFQHNIWATMEVKLKFDDLSGTWELRINEVTDVSGTGDTVFSSASVTTITVNGTNASGANLLLDDFRVVEVDGSGVNDFLGHQVIEGLRPIADAIPNDFTPINGGDNYVEIDESPSDGDTTYISTTSVSDTEQYDMGTLSVVKGAINGVQSQLECRVVSGDTVGIAPVVDGISAAGVSVVSNTFVVLQPIMEEDPATASPFTPSSVNGSEFGFRVTSIT
jgi:hypothetical protein